MTWYVEEFQMSLSWFW